MLPYSGRLSSSLIRGFILIPQIECLVVIISPLPTLFFLSFLWNMLALSLNWSWLQCPLILGIDLSNILDNLIPSSVQIQKLAYLILFHFLLVITFGNFKIVWKLLFRWIILRSTCVILETFSCKALSSWFPEFARVLFGAINFLSFCQKIFIYLGLFLLIQYWSSCLDRLIMQKK